MSDETDDRTARSLTQRPRNPRVPVNFAVDLEGQNASGEDFNIRAEAVLISRGGATLICDAPIDVGTPVRLTPPFGGALEAEVNGVWIDETDKLQRIGVRLIDQNGWFAE